MPNLEEHLRNAEHHLVVAEKLGSDEDGSGWGVIALFYSAHQLMQAVLGEWPDVPDRARHPRKHGGPNGMNNLVIEHFPELAVPYDSLFSASTAIRYDGERATREDYQLRMDDDYLPILTRVNDLVRFIGAADRWPEGLARLLTTQR